MLTSITKAKGGEVVNEKLSRMQRLIQIIDLEDTPIDDTDGDKDTLISLRYTHGGIWAR